MYPHKDDELALGEAIKDVENWDKNVSRRDEVIGALVNNGAPAKTPSQNTVPTSSTIDNNWLPGQSTSGYVQQDFSKYKTCRHDATDVFTLEGITYAGGSSFNVEDDNYPSTTLVVSLTGERRHAIIQSSPHWEELSQKYCKGSEEWIALRWPDMSIPTINLKGFWRDLHAQARSRNIKRVLFYCFGGHGRTGTALASVLIECAEFLPSDAIKSIRNVYCKEAIETKSQLDYLISLYLYHYPKQAKVEEQPNKEKGKKKKRQRGKP